MAEQAQGQAQGQAQDAARRAQEARRGGERQRGADDASRVAGQLASLSAETVGTWAELNQRIAQDWMRMSASALEENGRGLAEMQQAMFAAWRDTQDAAFRWQALWPEASRDPVGWYQRSFQQAVGVFQNVMDLSRRNAETGMRSFERMQSQSEEAARTMDDTFKQSASKIREIQNRTETLRVA